MIHLTRGRILLEKLLLCQVKIPIHQEQAGSGPSVQVKVFTTSVMLTASLLFGGVFSQRGVLVELVYRISL